KKQKLESDLELGEHVLKSLLPESTDVDCELFEVSSSYVQGTYIAGDFYSFHQSNDKLYFYLCDLSRTGLAASLIASYLKPFIDSIIEKDPEPSQLLHLCNQFLTKKNFPDLFVTVFYGSIDLKTKKLRYSCAGFRPMLLVSDTITELSTDGPPLGISLKAQYFTNEIIINDDQYIYCYTRELLSALSPESTLKGLPLLKSLILEKKDLQSAIIDFHSVVINDDNILQDDFMQLGIKLR
ncbi:SpoIIE family protein phosphatase, partial [bacterium]|nr:SpoIIE family protein phosphatase [bacterium]